LKQALSLLLVLLALLSSLQRPACCCQKTTSTPSRMVVNRHEHDCCKEEAGLALKRSDAFWQPTKPCCGITGSKLPAIANSFPLVGADDGRLVKVRLSGLNVLDSASCRSYLSETNRAPPERIGFGSQKTYLFKRTLLI
jgi:hypothetical protein